MLDIKLIREQPDLVRHGIRRRGEDPGIVDTILGLDARRRELLQQVEQLKATRNTVSKEISKMKDAAEREAKIASQPTTSLQGRTSSEPSPSGLAATGA